MTSHKSSLVAGAALKVATGVLAIGACVSLMGVKLREHRKKFNTPQPVATPNAYAPVGHYSQAVKHRGKVFVAGLLPIARDGTVLSDRPFAEQVRCVLGNLREILEAARSSVGKLVQVRVFVAGTDNYGAFEEAWAAFCAAEETRPARCIIPLPVLRFGVGVELEAIAAL